MTWEVLHAGGGAGLDYCPRGRMYHSAVSFAGSLYIYGGCRSMSFTSSDESLCEFFEFQLEAREWRPVEVRGTPPARCGHIALVFNDMMVVVDGDYTRQLAEPNALQLFNFATGAWTSVSAGVADTIARSSHEPRYDQSACV